MLTKNEKIQAQKGKSVEGYFVLARRKPKM
jgi:hypothetical protein